MENSEDPFDRWVECAPRATQLLVAATRASLEPTLLEREFVRVLFSHENKKLRALPLELLFERREGALWQSIAIRFEKRRRPLFTLDVENSSQDGVGGTHRPLPRLVRTRSANGFRAWYGIRSWSVLIYFLPETHWRKQIASEVQLAQAHLSQAFDYVDRGVVGPNMETWD